MASWILVRISWPPIEKLGVSFFQPFIAGHLPSRMDSITTVNISKPWAPICTELGIPVNSTLAEVQNHNALNKKHQLYLNKIAAQKLRKKCFHSRHSLPWMLRDYNLYVLSHLSKFYTSIITCTQHRYSQHLCIKNIFIICKKETKE